MIEHVYEFEMRVHALKEPDMDLPEKYKVLYVTEKISSLGKSLSAFWLKRVTDSVNIYITVSYYTNI